MVWTVAGRPGVSVNALNVVCVENQNYCGRGVRYVRALAEALAKNLPERFELTCLTDRAELNPFDGCAWARSSAGLSGWWPKLELFARFRRGRTLFFDLDSVVIGDLGDTLAQLRGVAFAAPYRRGYLQSSLMYWEGDHGDIYDDWNARGRPLVGTDQVVIARARPLAPDLLGICSGVVWHGSGLPHVQFSRWVPPPGARVVLFQGYPRPHHVVADWLPFDLGLSGPAIAKADTTPRAVAAP